MYNCDFKGSLARIGPNMLVTDDPVLMRRMNTVRSHYRRSNWYVGLRFDPNRDNVLSQEDEDKHFELRSKMAVGVSLHWSISFPLQTTHPIHSTQARKTRTSSKVSIKLC